MKEWNVYVNGECIGTIFDTTENGARCSALCKYDIPDDAELSVSLR